MENDGDEILWDLRIQTDKKLEVNRLDIMLLDPAVRSSVVINAGTQTDSKFKKEKKKNLRKHWRLIKEPEKL